jgi:uncharacterized protein with HEPN domain
MPPREWKLRVGDILDSIAAIEEYVRGMDYEAFRQDRKTIDAVVRRFTVIGEAAANIPSAITDQYPQVPWRQMRDMRNVVVHAYFGVNTEVLWDTVRNDLPPLVPALKEIMR